MLFKIEKRVALKQLAILLLIQFPLQAQASFIESTLGTAVVNDATATYFNPAALVLVKNPQIITQGTTAYFHSQFEGVSTSLASGVTQSGNSSTNTHYYSPSLYVAIPGRNNNFNFGLAVVSNEANRSADAGSVLRYVQSSNNIQDCDVVPGIAIKISEFLSLGGGINFSYANFDLRPITGFPGSNIADSESHNQSDGTGIGGNAGFLLKLGQGTLIGFNYRTITTYHLSGNSTFEGNPQAYSDNYHFKLSTPARSVLSMNQFVTQKLGFIGTVQYIQWSEMTNQHIYGIAGVSGGMPVIVNATVPYYLRDTWLLTLGSHYRILPQWVVRVAGSYNQSPGNPHYQIANGDSIILGASMGYEVTKTVTVDGSYAHAFLKDESINIDGNRFLINGVNKGSRDSVSLKLTFNL